MDKTWKSLIPRDLLGILLQRGIDESDFIFGARHDMQEDGQYMDGFVLLTKKDIYVAQLVDKEPGIRLFGGYQDDRLTKEEQERNWIIKSYETDCITKLDVQMLVSGGILLGTEKSPKKIDSKVKESQKESSEKDETNEVGSTPDLVIAVFTNSCMDSMKRMTRIYGKLKEDREISKEDLEGSKKEEKCPKCGMRYPNRERKICPKCMDKSSIFVRVLSYFKPHRSKLALMILCYLGTAGLNLIWPYLNGTILYDKVLNQNPAFLEFIGIPEGKYVALLGAVVVTMIMTSLTTQLLGLIQGVFTAKIVPDVVKEIKSEVFQSMSKLSVSFYSKRQTGGLMSRILDDAERVTDFYINGLPYFFIHIFTIIFICIVMFTMNWILAIASLILLPILMVISVRMLPRLSAYYSRRHRASRSMNSQVNDNITGARVVKAFGQEELELKRFDNYNQRVKRSELNLVVFDNRYRALYSIVDNLTNYIVMGLGSYLVLTKTDMELGILVTFIGYVGQLKGPLNFMSEVFRWWTESMNCSQRIFEIIDAIPEIKESENPVHLEKIRGEITLNNVTFGYEPHKPILKEMSFHVEAGQMLGIVGRSGAGKSTLVNLISRLYDVNEGEILIDGINVKDLAFEDLHHSIAMVSQETYIFMGTVAQNIAYAKPDATSAEIIQAAVYASAHDFICRMPDGYDTKIGSSGRQLSGGERQRISIARAILADPKILILDEATASVDTETEQAIQKSLSYLVKGRTTLSIAHRLSTLKDADRLVVIDNGKLTEEGTHQELIAQEGTYYTLMELQTKALALRAIE